jgi:hypothetical protein
MSKENQLTAGEKLEAVVVLIWMWAIVGLSVYLAVVIDVVWYIKVLLYMIPLLVGLWTLHYTLNPREMFLDG